MRIAICDDEAYFVETLKQYLWNEPHSAIDTFLSPEDLLKRCRTGKRYDVIFCDIVMKPYNGIELARKIRKFDNDVLLVYLTAYLKYAPQGYEVDAFRYLLKPIQEETVHSIMNDIRQKQQQQKKFFLETTVGSILTREDSIIYIEAQNKETLVFCEKDSFYAKKSLSELENLLTSTCFFRIHRKYIVHLNHVSEYDDCKLTLDNGKNLPISRRRSKKFSQTIQAFIKGEYI